MKNVLGKNLTDLMVYYDVVHNLVMNFIPELDEYFTK